MAQVPCRGVLADPETFLISSVTLLLSFIQTYIWFVAMDDRDWAIGEIFLVGFWACPDVSSSFERFCGQKMLKRLKHANGKPLVKCASFRYLHCLPLKARRVVQED